MIAAINANFPFSFEKDLFLAPFPQARTHHQQSTLAHAPAALALLGPQIAPAGKVDRIGKSTHKQSTKKELLVSRKRALFDKALKFRISYAIYKNDLQLELNLQASNNRIIESPGTGWV